MEGCVDMLQVDDGKGLRGYQEGGYQRGPFQTAR